MRWRKGQFTTAMALCLLSNTGNAMLMTPWVVSEDVISSTLSWIGFKRFMKCFSVQGGSPIAGWWRLNNFCASSALRNAARTRPVLVLVRPMTDPGLSDKAQFPGEGAESMMTIFPASSIPM